jgi:hypothetical protein
LMAPPACVVPLPFQTAGGQHGAVGGAVGAGAGDDGGGYLSEFQKRAGKKKRARGGGPLSSTKQQAQAPPPMPFELRSAHAAAGPANRAQKERVGEGGYGEEYEESRSLPAIIPMKGGEGGGERRRNARRRGKGDGGDAEEGRGHGTMSAPSRLKKEGEEQLRLPPPVRKSHDYEDVPVRGQQQQQRGGAGIAKREGKNRKARM